MATGKDKKAKTVKMPSTGLPPRQSIFSSQTRFGQGSTPHKSFIPPTFRVTQHKGGGGK